jgi:hypothetical protein
MLCVLFGNLFLSCLLTINCWEFWPTLSFLGSLSGHDRLFVFGCTAFALVVIVMSASVTLALHETSDSWTISLLQLIAGTASSFLVTLAVVDEVNGIIIHSLEGSHVFLSLSFLLLSLTWGYIVWRESVSSKLCSLASTTRTHLGLCAFLAALALYEWEFAYTIHSSSLVNETAEALCEWLLVIVAVLTPAFLGRQLPEFRVSLSSS